MLEKAINSVMPFGIKLRRTGRYILSHKNSFLVRVQLLDNTIMECTLTVENTGNDCLNAVANKLDLKEVQYFGLRYYNKQQIIRWVELDKPLKKQVDKNAQDPTLYFGVMFYVANLELLQQEITRYLFYLQLKNNVIECRLPRNTDQAIEFASYMLQAEFGDYNPEIHTVQYFRDFILFPEILAQTEEILDSLTADTLIRHQHHRGLTPPDAEYNYILKVMHLDGYGEQTYYAKDSQNGVCEIGCSFVGIVSRQLVPTLPEEEGQNPHEVAKTKVGKVTWYEWNEVEHVFCNKSIIFINLKKDDTCLQFHVDDAESAKYACRMFECSRKFYSVNREFQKKLQLENGNTTAIQRRPTLRRLQDTSAPEVHTSSTASEQQSINTSQPQANFISSQENLQSYHVQQDNTQYYASQTSLDHAYVSQTSLNHVSALQQEYGYPNGYGQGGSMYSSPSINSLARSQTQLNRPSPTSSNLSLCSSDRHLAKNGVPVYRCTPDYEQAVRQRRRYSSYLENQAAAQQQAANSQTGVPNTSRKPRPHSMIYSPHELLQQAIQGPHYAQYPPQNPLALYNRGLAHRVDSATHLPTSQTHIHRQFDTSVESLPPVNVGAPQHSQHVSQYNPHEMIQSQHNEVVHHGSPGNAILAASTPELANSMQQQQAKGYASSEMQLYRYYTKPPPPYPPNNSTSTPDLSLHRYSAVSASSPDLHHGYAVGQRCHLQHPVHSPLAEGGYQVMPGHPQRQMTGNENPQPQDQVTIIRGVCTSVEALHQSQQNMMEMNVHEMYGNNQPHAQHTQTSEQTVQAYLQQLSLEQQQTRTRHPGQHHQARHHRPVSYPPRLNHPVLMGVEEQDIMFSQNGGRLPPVPQQNFHSSQSHLGSSSSTVGSPYGSQQYLRQQNTGSQISLQRSQLAPPAHPVIIQQPLPQRADTTMNVVGQAGGSQINVQQYHPSLQQSHYVHVGQDLNPDEEYEEQGELSYDLGQLETNGTETDDKEFKATPQHSQMPSNATMLIHSSDSESEEEYVPSDDEESAEEDKSERMINFPPADYRQMSLTTIDQWPKRKPQEMYVPPKPKPELQQYLTDSDPTRAPPPYPEGNPKIRSSDHDPPISYRKPPQMESCDEGDLTKVSVFPHPNPTPTQMHMSTLSETNPFYSPTINMNNPFYNFEVEATERLAENTEENKLHGSSEMIPTLQVQNTETKMLAEQASEGLRQARRSTRKTANSKFSTPNGGIQSLNQGPPSPSAGTPDERVLNLERQVEDGQVLIEYEKIPKKKDSSASPASGDPAGLRDRTKSVVPYLSNRVKLKPTGTNGDGYVNASHVKVEVAGQMWHYIMGQSPLDDYLEEFWDVVWQNDVSIIVMMTREVEDGKLRCGRYWPESPGDPNALLFGNYRVTCEIVSDSQPSTPNHTSLSPDEDGDKNRLPSTTCENLVTSHLVLQKAGTAECRAVWHLQYLGWPDTGAPKHAGDFLAFLEELESVRRLANENLEEDDISLPIMVHCTSGAGRSGVVVLCELMKHSLEHNETTTVPQMLKLVRDQRMHCVQTVSQYNFVYKVLILFLKSLRLI